jgi:hypothetical protein
MGSMFGGRVNVFAGVAWRGRDGREVRPYNWGRRPRAEAVLETSYKAAVRKLAQIGTDWEFG